MISRCKNNSHKQQTIVDVMPSIFIFFFSSADDDIGLLYLSYFYGYITNSKNIQLPVGLIAQIVKHCTGIAEVMDPWA